jgi:alpha-galactosidase
MKSLLVSLLLLAAALPALAQAPDLTSPDLWKPGQAPFSFTYNGKDSATLLPGWQTSEEAATVAGHAVHRYLYTDPGTRLVVTAEVRTFPDFPGAAEWVLYFKNSGTADTPIIENILPLHWSFPAEPEGCTVHHAKGSSANADDFQPLEESFGPGGSDHQESPGGNPSSDNSLPMFNFQTRDHGYILAIGWTGGWKADFANAQDGKSLSMSAGMKATHLLLHPGEEIRTPRIVLLPWAKEDWTDAQNDWRRMVYAHYTPQVNGQALRGPIDTGAWGGGPVAEKIAFVKWMGQNKIPVSLYGIDAGWFGHSIGSEQDPTSPWWLNRGDWYPSPLYYPNGIGPLGAACKANGYGFSLWIEPETAMPGTRIVTEHPDWYLHSTHPVNPGVMMADYGDPACLKGITDMVSGFITDFGMTMYRQDFNIPPADYWDPHDTPDRVGMTEIGHIEGLYQFLDTLLARHPGLIIDNCASGGRRLDIEMMSRSFVMWRSDHGATDLLANQGFTQGLAPWNPQNSGFATLSEDAPWKHPGPYSDPLSLYRLRIGYSNNCAFPVGAAGVTNPDWIAWVKQEIGEYREVQPFMYGDFYALTPYTLDDTVWSAWQLNRPDRKDGCVILLKRGSSLYPALELGLRHLDPAATYEVELRHTLDHAPVQEMKGSDLASLHVTLNDRPDSEIIFYHQK